MSTYDPITIISPNSAPYKPVYSCERQKAVSGFTSALDFDDKAAIVTFESSASTVCELTDDTYELYWGSAAFYNGGGTNFDAALRKSIDILQASSGSTRKRIILLSDGYSSVSDSILNELKADYIKVYTIGIGNCSDTVLSKIATETGGEYIKAYKASDLVDIYANIGIGGDFDTTDNDGDGLYDAVESAGIRLQNGNIIYTDPTTKHTDSDGLEDGEEIDPTPKKSEKIEYNDDGTVKTVKGYYFVMKSDPREEDTDGDGALDFEDATPSNYNEKMSYIFTKTDCQWFITHESILREVDMNNDGKSVTHKYTVSANDFKNEWNSMGLNGDGKKEFIIDEVHLIYHGAPQLICVSDSGWIYSDSSASGYSSSDITVADLDAKEIEYLNISSCNGGNLDFNSTNGIAGYGDNMALTFLKSNSRIDKVTGWDGSASYGGLYFNFFGNEAVVSWESSSTSDNFDNWSLAVNGYKRKAEQRITYTKNADGTINIDPNEKHRRFFQ